MRPRWRYLAVTLEAHPTATVDRDQFQTTVWQAARQLIGDAGSAAVDLTVMRFSYHNGDGEAVVRTYRDATTQARAVLACISTIESYPIGVRVRGISGTIHSCEEKYLGRATEHSQERTVVFEDKERTAIIRSPRADIRDGSTFIGATDLDFEHE